MLPEITNEQRQAALSKAVAARMERKDYKARMKAGGAALAEALDEPCMQKERVRLLLRALPGIGLAKSGKIMRELEISEGRRVRGLGSKQRAALLAWAEKQGL